MKITDNRSRLFHLIVPLLFLSIMYGCAGLSESICNNDVLLPSFDSVKTKIVNDTIITGFGTMELSVDGVRYRGFFELARNNSGQPSAKFYSYFGTLMGDLMIVTDTVSIKYQGKTECFHIDEQNHLFGFSWGNQINTRELFSLLSGLIPQAFFKGRFIPESCIKKRSQKIINYQSDSGYVVQFCFSSRLTNLKRIILDYSAHEKPFYITASKFIKGIPREIIFKTDNNNYLKVEYKKWISNTGNHYHEK